MKNKNNKISNDKILISTSFDLKTNFLMKNSSKSLLQGESNLLTDLIIEKKSSIIDLYLENFSLYNTNIDNLFNFSLYSSKMGIEAFEVLKKLSNIPFKGIVVVLPNPLKKLEKLSFVLSIRKSVRNYEKRKISLKELSTILWWSLKNGDFVENLNNNHYPSGGGLFSMDLYFYANNIEGLEKSFYFYDKINNSIIKINGTNNLEIAKFANMKNIKNLNNISLFLAFAWNSNLNRFKYGNSF